VIDLVVYRLAGLSDTDSEISGHDMAVIEKEKPVEVD